MALLALLARSYFSRFHFPLPLLHHPIPNRQCCAATQPASTSAPPPPGGAPHHQPPPPVTRQPTPLRPPPIPSCASSTRRPAPRLPRRNASASASASAPAPPPRRPRALHSADRLPPDMEVEIKLRLPDAAAHRRLSAFMAPRLRRTHEQRNLFFDSAARALAAATAALRVRLYHGGGGGGGQRAPSKAVLALKRRPRLEAGVSRVEEVEEPLDQALALACADDPARLGGLDSPIIRLVAAEYGVGGDAAPFLCLGGFWNTRAVYEYDLEENGGGGLVLELDETRFDFGTSYELECETAEPDRVKEVLERLLTVAGVPYEYSRSNKFACFMAGKLLP